MREHVPGVADDPACHLHVPCRRVDDRRARCLQRRVVNADRVVVGGRGVRRRGGRDVRLEVDERERQAQTTDTVGDRVVDLLQQRRASVFESFDECELPQRTRTVERPLGERPAQVEQRAVGAAPR